MSRGTDKAESQVELSPQQAQRLVDAIMSAENKDAAIQACGAAFSFLIAQLHSLGDQANGYPRGPIDGHVWQAGRDLTLVCDRFADAVAHWNQRKGEEQATGLAAAMALQVMAHYPGEIFPRVLRNAKCRETLEMTEKAIEGYRCITDDFEKLELESELEDAGDLDVFQLAALNAASEAFEGIERLAPDTLSSANKALHRRLKKRLSEL